MSTYVVNCYKISFVFEHHYLVFRITTDFRVFPIIDRYLGCFGTVVAGHVEYAASRHVLFFAARALLADAHGVVKIRVRRHCAGAEPRVTSLG